MEFLQSLPWYYIYHLQDAIWILTNPSSGWELNCLISAFHMWKKYKRANIRCKEHYMKFIGLVHRFRKGIRCMVNMIPEESEVIFCTSPWVLSIVVVQPTPKFVAARSALKSSKLTLLALQKLFSSSLETSNAHYNSSIGNPSLLLTTTKQHIK